MQGQVFTNRFEIKYLVKTSRVLSIKRRLARLLVPDPHNQDERGYYNHSIYFDSPQNRFYYQKHEGQENRTKPRLRAYRATPDGAPLKLFLEFKEKQNRIVKKQRIEVSPSIAQRLLDSADLTDDLEKTPSQVLNQFYIFTKRFQIEPRVAVLYNRSAYFSPIYKNVRITFDSGIRGSLAARLNAPLSSLVHILPPGLTMIELKYNDKLPIIFFREIESLELEQVTFSKYGVSLETCSSILERTFHNF